MRKVFLITCFILCLFFMSACSAQEETDMKQEETNTNPLLGQWEVKSDLLEGSFVFEETEEGICGSYRFFDYGQDIWEEFSYSVKEQTDNAVVLLVENGKIYEMPYTIVGDHLYLNGVLFTNNATEVPLLDSVTSIAWLNEGLNYSLYDQIFMGMHIEDICHVLDKDIPLSVGEGNGDYSVFYRCDYCGELSLSDGDYYCLELGFDSNKRLVFLYKQGPYNKEVVDAFVQANNDAFGEFVFSEWESDDGVFAEKYQWSISEYHIEMRIYSDTKETGPDTMVMVYWYEPAAVS